MIQPPSFRDSSTFTPSTVLSGRAPSCQLGLAYQWTLSCLRSLDNEVVVILVNCDSSLYLALLAGMMRAGVVPFPMSPRNSAPAIVNMLKRTSRRRIICQPIIIAESTNREVILGATALPTCHLMGICIQLYYPLVSGLPVCLFTPKAPASPVFPTPRNTIEAAEAAKCTKFLTVPAFAEACAKLKDDVE
ncbi:uncharacterized protein PHACADRAFT_213634 [Phanerochaete carnosa HHB-10118-sp]|uniref:AMP-dependent synthetase/ligase domain-containing protein n=1 Tax=Phanerochaete carnosa (strain HHB-10118-sp) TaxID=650164 RepID=K5VVX9_PHACS|nr:uncharacterized protein PHACADRAFT_213634 [Phanerochaete carnosa HHB-10118-sp]EKM50739.1 hypothetical protein PHACADRAFT_213634 [Phanerochaete carnosa HHB-10118-sp]